MGLRIFDTLHKKPCSIGSELCGSSFDHAPSTIFGGFFFKRHRQRMFSARGYGRPADARTLLTPSFLLLKGSSYGDVGESRA